MIPLNNMVLLKPIIDATERVYKSGIILGVSKAAKDQYLKNYARRNFEVVGVPDKLDFPDSRLSFFESGYAFRYRTEVELQLGDIVWVKLRSGHRAKEISVDGEKHYLVHYAECFVAQRRCFHTSLYNWKKNKLEKDDVLWEVIPLNGNIICEKVMGNKNKFSIKETEEPGKLKIKYVGNQSPSYFSIVNDEFVEIPIPKISVKKGDIIQADGPYINIEGEYFHDFDGKKQPVAIHTTYIGALIK